MKTKFITKEDKAAIRRARSVLNKIAKEFIRLGKVRKWCDDNKYTGKDPGGNKWKAATAKLYGLYDEVEKSKLVFTHDFDWSRDMAYSIAIGIPKKGDGSMYEFKFSDAYKDMLKKGPSWLKKGQE